jgi:cytidine deaminase
MPESDEARAAWGATRLSNAELISRAAEALNPQELAAGLWVADVGAAVEAVDGRIYTGASIGGNLSVCAEVAAMGQLVTASTPTITRVVAVWTDPTDGVLHVIPPCGRCREFLRTVSQQNLDATVILGPEHAVALGDLLPYAGWYAERVDPA